MAIPDAILNADEYTIVPHVAAVDEFIMKNDDGTFVANINEPFLDRLVARMNAREAQTGDLSPLVIGHTEEGQAETSAPPIIGWARNWVKAQLFNTPRKAAFFDAWIKNDYVELAKKYPRRSCEVWPGRYEVDPISFLGATTPARDLGLLKLSRDGSFVYTSPEDMTVPTDNKPEDKEKKPDSPSQDNPSKPKADPSTSGAAVKADSKQDQILAALQQILQMLQGGEGAGATATASPPAPAAPAAPAADADADDGQMSDADIEALLQQMGGEGGEGAAGGGAPDATSRKGEEKVQNSAAGAGGGDNTYVHLSRQLEAERLANEDMRIKLSRIEISQTLRGYYDEGLDVNPQDEALISDLIAMPPDIRNRQLNVVKKLSRTRLDAGGGSMLNRALDEAVSTGPQGVKRVRDREDVMRLSRKASQEGKSFEAVAREEGYTL